MKRTGHALGAVILFMFGFSHPAASQESTPSSPDFARDVAPILQKSCLRCHAPGNAKGDLSLTTASNLLEDAHVIPGDPDSSPLLTLISPGAKGKRPEMPKEGEPLTTEQVDVIRRWIASGAKWPEGLVLQERAKADQNWWSLRPLALVEPKPKSAFPSPPPGWAEQPIDRFVLEKLEAKGLTPSPPAQKSTLIRRVTYDLTGLPPTPEEVENFLTDPAPEAYERVVDRLLASPHYGEQWGRHWLDVVRFGESTGFERNVIIDNAWPFRDYVIRSFNQDKPFDRFTIEQLAGDIVAPGDPNVAVGTAFLVCGPYDNVGNQDPVQAAQIHANTLDDMIRATGESFLGITIGCARCHDHKFDPIAQRDYYRLYSTFAGVSHGSRAIASQEQVKTRAAQLRPYEEQRDLLTTGLTKLRAEIDRRGEEKAASHEANWTRPQPVRSGIEEKFAPVKARFVRLIVEGIDTDPNRQTGFGIEEFEVWSEEESSRNVGLTSLGAKVEGSSRNAADFKDAYSVTHVNDGRYGDRWIAAAPELTITLAEPQTISRIFFCSDRGGTAGDNPIATFVSDYRIEVSNDGKTWLPVIDSHDRKPVNAAHRRKRIYDREITPEERNRLALYTRQLGEAQKSIAAVPAFPSWWVGTFNQPTDGGRVFLGGDPQKKGPDVSPSSLSVLGQVTTPYELATDSPEGERRLALARWLVAPENPLTPRVLANRLWQHHFGTGLVDTPSDFGMMGGKPSHPELLDWLARHVQADGWRLKPLHRLIVTSQTYRQSSDYREEPAKVDGASRLLWRYPPHRINAEELRDTLLAVSGKLDLRMGGPGFRLYRYLEDNVATYVPLDEPGPETYRRAVYHQGGRAARVDLLSDFDCPDNASSSPSRATTTSPLQALTMLNHRFNLDLAVAFADRLTREGGADQPEKQIELAFLLAYTRHPSDEERAASFAFLQKEGLRAFTRALLNSSEMIFVR